MSNLDKLLKLYLLQEIGDNTSIEDVYTNKQNLFNNELFDDGEKIANVNDKDIDKLTGDILNNYNYSKASEPEILNTLVNKKIQDVKCESDEDKDKCLENESRKVLAYEYSVNPPPNCNERILRLMGFLQIIINQTNSYKKRLFEYDLVLDNLDINRGDQLKNAKTYNETLLNFINNIGNIEDKDEDLQKIVEIINKNPDMKSEIENIFNIDNLLIDNIKTNFDDDKKLLDALVTVQKAILDKTLPKRLKRISLVGISNSEDKAESIKKLLTGIGDIKLNLV